MIDKLGQTTLQQSRDFDKVFTYKMLTGNTDKSMDFLSYLQLRPSKFTIYRQKFLKITLWVGDHFSYFII